jgi:hypothetical protein
MYNWRWNYWARNRGEIYTKKPSLISATATEEQFINEILKIWGKRASKGVIEVIAKKVNQSLGDAE